jgi:hypothetical protein
VFIDALVMKCASCPLFLKTSHRCKQAIGAMMRRLTREADDCQLVTADR